jgi:hypothetical protein
MIGMGMNMRMVPNLRLQRECSVCLQTMDEEKARDTTVIAAVFGKAAYAVCCCCGQEVREFKDPAYQKRWRQWAKQQQRRSGK